MLENLQSAINAVATKQAIQNVSTAVSATDAETIFFERLRNLGFDMSELEPILRHKGDMLINSGAGAGKTTTIVLKLIKALVTGEATAPVQYTDSSGFVVNGVRPLKVLVATYLKSGAEDIERSFYDWCTKLGVTGVNANNIVFTTLHAEFYSVLKSIVGNIKIREDTGSLVRSVMKKYNIRNVNSYGKNPTAEEVSDVESIFTYVRNVLDEKRLQHPLLADYRLDASTLSMAIKTYEDWVVYDNQLDFEMLQTMLLTYIPINPAIKDMLANRYDFICVDEFQDTSQVQYEVLRPYFENSKVKIAIGDDDQTIYTWRGSDINIITKKFEEDYKPAVFTLSTNYRCCSEILKPVIPSISRNKNRHAKSLKASKTGGKLEVLFDLNYEQFIDKVQELSKGVNTLGIISRVNSDLLIPAILLELEGTIDYTISKGISLSKKIPSIVLGAIDLITKSYNSNFESLFNFISRSKGTRNINRLCETLAANRNMSIYTMATNDIAASVPELYEFLRALRIAKKSSDLTAYVFILNYLKDEVLTSDNLFCLKAKEFITFVKYLVCYSPKLSAMNFSEIDRYLTYELPLKFVERNAKNVNIPCSIKLTTVHDAKGKEWDSVIIWNDIDGTFPSRGNRGITDEEFEEERRLHYIAWTRARKHLVVCTKESNPSPFLLECDLQGVQGCEFLKMPDKLLMSRPSTDIDLPLSLERDREVFKNLFNTALHTKAEPLYTILSDLLSCTTLDKLLDEIMSCILRSGDTEPISLQYFTTWLSGVHQKWVNKLHAKA